MNCPSRTEEPEGTGFNQNPSALSADLTTRNDLNGIANSRELRRIPSIGIDAVVEPLPDADFEKKKQSGCADMEAVALDGKNSECHVREDLSTTMGTLGVGSESTGGGGSRHEGGFSHYLWRAKKAIITYGKFVGPGMMVSDALPSVRNKPDL